MNKIETFGEYQELAKRTCVDISIGENGEDMNAIHMTLGIITEIGEVLDIFKKHIAYGKAIDTVNLGEELADIAWYIANRSTFTGELIVDLLEEDFLKYKNAIEEDLKDYGVNVNDRTMGMMVPLLKEEFRYYDEEQETGLESLTSRVLALRVVASWYDLDFYQLLTNNINKLRVRYPEKFTNENALNRDLEAERAELEK